MELLNEIGYDLIKADALKDRLVGKDIGAPTVWDTANGVLYDLCQEHPHHTKDEEIIAKVWLIGRSYAAAIERRPTTNEDAGYETSYIYEHLAPEILKSIHDLDEELDNLKGHHITTNNIDSIYKSLKLHKKLTDAIEAGFKQLLKPEEREKHSIKKRSFASKYLHFHLPDMFYIYDSTAFSAAKSLCLPRKDYLNLIGLNKEHSYDPEYAIFVARMAAINTYVQKNCNYTPTPRQLDNLLYS